MYEMQQDYFEQKFKKMEQSLVQLDAMIRDCEKRGDKETTVALQHLYRNTLQSVQHHQTWLEHHGS